MNDNALQFAVLDAPTPWWPSSSNSRVIADKDGHPRVQILPSGNAERDHALALAISRLVNAHTGVDQRPLDHSEAIHLETQRAARQMGGRSA